MTSFAFILGVLPLAISTGAGAVGRQIMGTAVVGGTTLATVIGVFLIPAMYTIFARLASARTKTKAADAIAPQHVPAAQP
jgi:multidrug efflux pump subunit AcrB